MKVWAKTEEFSEGKFLVIRRDGTTPGWPHFVMGARDPAVPIALRAYALYSRTCGFDEAYSDSVRELADDFNAYRLSAGDGDPDARPHRVDDPVAIGMMRHEISLADIIKTLRWCAERITVDGGMTDAEQRRTEAAVAAILAGHKPDLGDFK